MLEKTNRTLGIDVVRSLKRKLQTKRSRLKNEMIKAFFNCELTTDIIGTEYGLLSEFTFCN